MNNAIKGYALGAIAAATYGMNPAFTLPLYAIGIDSESVLLFRYLFAILILGIMLKARGHSFGLSPRHILPLVALGLVFAFSSEGLFLSYNYMDAGIASTLLFVYPIMVALIMAVFFHERFTSHTAVCLIMATIGIALLYRASDGSTLNLTGTLFVMSSSLSYAIYIVAVNRSIFTDIPTIKITFYALLFGSLLFAVILAFRGHVCIPDSQHWYLWTNLAALGLLPTAVSLICTTAAIQYIGSTPTAILGAIEPVTAVILGIIFFNESLTMREFSGLVLIIFAVSLVVAGGNINKYVNRLRKMFPRIIKVR